MIQRCAVEFLPKHGSLQMIRLETCPYEGSIVLLDLAEAEDVLARLKVEVDKWRLHIETHPGNQ